MYICVKVQIQKKQRCSQRMILFIVELIVNVKRFSSVIKPSSEPLIYDEYFESYLILLFKMK